MEKQKTDFLKVYKINVNSLTEKKNGLTYLTWAHAWKLFVEHYPDASYRVVKFENGKPYYEDLDHGLMVYTEMTANGTTYEMWLPVMDGANKSMRRTAYNYTTRFGEKSVDAISMFDINKTIMRCLVKNMAMFGLGLYIYAGEDLPETPEAPELKPLKNEDFERAVIAITDGKFTSKNLESKFKLTPEQIKTITNIKSKK